MGMFYDICSSKASRKLPDGWEEEATVLGGARVQADDSTRRTD